MVERINCECLPSTPSRTHSHIDTDTLYTAACTHIPRKHVHKAPLHSYR